MKPWNIRHNYCFSRRVDTELTKTITDEDIAKGMSKTYENAIPGRGFCAVVAFAISQPDDVDVNEILFRPTVQVYKPSTGG
ncbi:short-chain dehydrogenase/reductase SDR [Klebsiella variicola]|nr:short-chain dehydrogenase/reductase SDR [Klebsiella variicola]